MKSSNGVLVIGAGVVGACTALMLQRYGHAVTIIELPHAQKQVLHILQA